MQKWKLPAYDYWKEIAISEHAPPTSTGFSGMAALMLLALMIVAHVPGQAFGQHAHIHDEAALGVVHFDVSCSDAVTADFDRAVALLHHMKYVESRAAFEKIASADPECGMAHWGIAVTLFQPLWPTRPSTEVLRRGWSEVEKARTLGSKSDREADLVAAAGAFFREPSTATWWTRIDRWS